MKSMLSQQTPIRSLLKIRPMAIGLLDKRKIRYWDSLDKPLGDLFRRSGRAEIGMDDFLDEVSYASVPAPDTDWSAMPIYMLVDFLTHQHRDLLLQEVGDIQHLLDIHTLSDSGESGNLRKLMRAFQAWVKDFQAHIDQEEGYLFPKVLRYEACLKDRKVHPEFHLGSIQDLHGRLGGPGRPAVLRRMRRSGRLHARPRAVPSRLHRRPGTGRAVRTAPGQAERPSRFGKEMPCIRRPATWSATCSTSPSTATRPWPSNAGDPWIRGL